MTVKTDVEKPKPPVAVASEADARDRKDVADVFQALTMATAFRIEEHGEGEPIFRQGDLGSQLYLIKEGQVSLERSVNLGGREARATLSLLGKCRILGCWACLLGDCRHLAESAICQKPTQVVSAHGHDLELIMKANPEIAIALLKRLCFMLDEKLHDCYCAMGTL